MAATKYQVLYRYTNPNSNQFVLNDVETPYKECFEFYHDEHKIAIGTTEEKLQANTEQSDYIIEGNNTANDNYNMLFKFKGTKRINKKVWMPESIGYVIRDKEAVRNETTRAVDGDYSGDYLLIEGDSIENGVVVAKKNINKAITVCEDNSLAANKINYTSDELKSIVINSTIYTLNSTELSTYKKGTGLTYLSRDWQWTGNKYAWVYSNEVYAGPIFIDEAPILRSGNYLSNVECVSTQENSCEKVVIEPKDIQTYTIPAHYEEVAEYPYLICDTYERIEQSPWFILSTHASLQSALEKVKAIVKTVGIDNVKLIKVVPTEQFIKIN